LWLIRISLTSGLARISEFPPAEPRKEFSNDHGILLIRQIDRACRSRESSAPSEGLKVAELCVNGAR
jgi:hypothetical protein